MTWLHQLGDLIKTVVSGVYLTMLNVEGVLLEDKLSDMGQIRSFYMAKQCGIGVYECISLVKYTVAVSKNNRLVMLSSVSYMIHYNESVMQGRCVKVTTNTVNTSPPVVL